jgi:hypothetical protein
MLNIVPTKVTHMVSSVKPTHIMVHFVLLVCSLAEWFFLVRSNWSLGLVGGIGARADIGTVVVVTPLLPAIPMLGVGPKYVGMSTREQEAPRTKSIRP